MFERAFSGRSDSIITALPSAALSGSVCKVRPQKSFFFQPVQRDVDGAAGSRAMCAGFDFNADGHSVCPFAKPDDRKKHQLLELAERSQ
jgi:hypothetical protein